MEVIAEFKLGYHFFWTTLYMLSRAKNVTLRVNS